MDRPAPPAGAGGPLRLLWLIDSLAAGGAEALAATFAAAVDPRRVRLHVACLKSLGGNPFEAELRARGVPVTLLGARNLRDLAAFRRLLALLRRERIELVHAHLAYAALWGALAAPRVGVPLVATLHLPPEEPSEHPPWSREGVRQRLLGRALDRRAAAVVAVSEAVRRAHLERGRIRAEKLVVAHNGVDAAAFRPPAAAQRRELRARVRRELGLPPEALVAITVSVLRPGKGIEVLLAAARDVAAALPEARFVVAGDGPLRAALEVGAREAGVEELLRWIGFRRDVAELLAASDLFVLPTLADALPTALLEAMAAGLPVVASAVGGVPEVVEDGETGVLVPPGDAAALAHAVAALLPRPERRAAMGERGLRRVEERFSVERWVERLGRIYEGALRGESPARRTAEELPLRILVVEFAGRGGMIHYAFQLCRGLAAAGADVTLVTDRHFELGSLPAPFRVLPVLQLWDPKPPGEVSTARAAVLAHRARRLGRAWIYYREWARLLRLARRFRPDVVQLGDVRFAADLPFVAALARTAALLAGVCHNVHPYAAGGRAAGLFRRSELERRLRGATFRRFDALLVHFESNRRELLASYPLDPARVLAIPHGHEAIFAELADPTLTSGAVRQELGLGTEDRVLLLFGGLSRYTGIDLALRALPRVLAGEPRARLVVAGFPAPDFDLAAHRTLAEELGVVAAVRWVPRYLEAGEVAAWMGLAAAAVLPYRAVFQSGALLVAQTFGVPAVAAAVGAMPEAIEDGATGLLVPPEDPEALAAALLRLLAEPMLARRLGERAREQVLRRFAWESIGAEVLAFYERRLRGESQPAAPAERRRSA
ncbi:MAG TPA: glycosyltransferase family 4 protein [Thermoanaerobaculia bacterium]|nr:glycosyltransferase family 4 protein [Thermoanaerobaculia bacterium]